MNILAVSLLLVFFLVVILLLVIFSLATYPARRRLWAEIESKSQERLWPRRWTFLALLPIFGRYYFKQLESKTQKPLRLRFPVPEPILDREIRPKAEWLLFEEQHDHLSGEHHGTRVHLLEPQNAYQMVTTSEDRSSPTRIYVELPRPTRELTPWLSLAYYGVNWQATNDSRHGFVVPVLRKKAGDLNVESLELICAPQDRVVLQTGDRFIVGLSEFQLIHIPPLGIFWRGKNKIEHLEMREGSTFSFVAPRAINSENEYTPPLAINSTGSITESAFRQYDFSHNTIQNRITYLSVLSGQESELDPKTRLFIQPGDRFLIYDLQDEEQVIENIWVDYL